MYKICKEVATQGLDQWGRSSTAGIWAPQSVTWREALDTQLKPLALLCVMRSVLESTLATNKIKRYVMGMGSSHTSKLYSGTPVAQLLEVSDSTAVVQY